MLMLVNLVLMPAPVLPRWSTLADSDCEVGQHLVCEILRLWANRVFQYFAIDNNPGNSCHSVKGGTGTNPGLSWEEDGKLLSGIDFNFVVPTTNLGNYPGLCGTGRKEELCPDFPLVVEKLEEGDVGSLARHPGLHKY